jgi:hypothetical protein
MKNRIKSMVPNGITGLERANRIAQSAGEETEEPAK